MRSFPRAFALTGGLFATFVAAETPHELHVMAFNVLFEHANDKQSVQAIRDEDPDVVCFTELTSHFVKRFERELAEQYPYRAFVPQKGTWGVGIASKRPLRSIRTGPVAPLKLPAMEASVSLDGERLRLLCVHLNPPLGKHRKNDTVVATLDKNAAVRLAQATTLITRYEKVEGPLVLLGDFNEVPDGEAMQALKTAGFERGCALSTSSCTPTFPGPVQVWPALFEIDHVLARGLRFTWAKTVRAGGSDHFPVAARLALPPTPR